uniref:Rho-GAP domain-containing protein n=1 Tax=Meloidogyne javanica TaxID=6303 RepID=A0A915N6I8_MELJA
MSDQQLGPLTNQQIENQFSSLDQKMPLSLLFGQLMENTKQFASRADSTVQQLQQRFIESLESRQKEHNIRRRKLKVEYAKQRKQMETCVEELRRARQTHTNKGEQYLRAREVTIRQERECHQILPINTQKQQNLLIRNSEGNSSLGQQQIFQKRRKEVEKRRKVEEEALNRKEDAEQEVCRLERELDGYRAKLNELRCRTIHELSDLIRQCELTTIACTATLLKGIANLWAPVPQELERLADVARTSQPGQEFMSFLQQQQQSNSLLTSNVSTTSNGQCKMIDSSNGSNIPFCSSDSGSSPHQRPTTLLATQKGSSTTPSIASACSSSIPSPNRAVQRRNALAAAEEHLLVTECEHLLLFDALKCQCCALVWHRKCLPNVQIRCGPNMRKFDEQNDGKDLNLRRTSIFGVPLNIHLGEQKRQIPLILEKCLDELQRRGMCCKGLYRTCGVKSKVEEICVQFEQSTNDLPVDLSNVHPMNIASVVKLYLRRLPEPLLSYELYTEWFELQNLMTASNLAAVIAPSLLWQRLPLPNAVQQQQQFISDAHRQSRAVELIIKYAFEIFDEDRRLDWCRFFADYPDNEMELLVNCPNDLNNKQKIIFGRRKSLGTTNSTNNITNINEKQKLSRLKTLGTVMGKSCNNNSNQNQRKLLSHKSMDESFVQQQNGQHSDLGRRATLRSGEVTVQLGKDCLPDDGVGGHLSVRLLSSCDTDDVSYV